MDRTIPCKSLIMCCHSMSDLFCEEPEGIVIRTYQSGDEKAWAELECSMGEFENTNEAEVYFEQTYGANIEKRNRRCLFACTAEGVVVGSCMAWHDRKGQGEVASLQWLAVAEEYQNRGIGKALLYETMRLFLKAGTSIVFLHAQTWNYKAIDLFCHYGFWILKGDTFSSYKNQYRKAIPILKEYLSNNTMIKLLYEAEKFRSIALRRKEEERQKEKRKREMIDRQRIAEQKELKALEWRRERWRRAEEEDQKRFRYGKRQY